ncbi:hypothetical protein RB195_002363 [Necator americanus]|uniref:Uncharacterized protein n=1 Tax=Necator americanus TaxID=51031 RepID=A0ABR1DLK6_NECAM
MLIDYILILSRLLVTVNALFTAIFLLCCRSKKKAYPSAFMEGYGSKDDAPGTPDGSRDNQFRAPEQNRAPQDYPAPAGANNADFQNRAAEYGGPGARGGGGYGGAPPPGQPIVPLNIRPPPPAQNKMAGTFDPNYQTLAALNNEDVFKRKDAGGGPFLRGPVGGSAEYNGGAGSAEYGRGGGAGSAEYLRGGGSAEYRRGGAGAGAAAPARAPAVPIRAPAAKGKVAAFDPNYQTLAAINNIDVFRKGSGEAFGARY